MELELAVGAVHLAISTIGAVLLARTLRSARDGPEDRTAPRSRHDRRDDSLEDGPNLVVLAMNGWDEGHTAWWRNLEGTRRGAQGREPLPPPLERWDARHVAPCAGEVAVMAVRSSWTVMAEVAASGRLPAPRKVALRDGSEVLMRPVRPDDGDLVRRAFEALSERSRYLRFHAHVNHLGDAQIRMVTSADHRSHAVWVALDPEAPVDTIVGLASYVRLDRPGEVAEATVAVADAFQGRGLGTILLGVLVDVARHNGIACFRNYVLAENAPMLRLFDELGAERQPLDGHVHVYVVDLALPEHLDELPDTPSGRAIRALASGECASALVAFHPPLWMLRKRVATLPRAVPQLRARRERADLAAWLDEVLGDRPEERAEDGPAKEGEQTAPHGV